MHVGCFERQMYESAKFLGIMLITISLRPSLAKYHHQSEDGSASWALTDIVAIEYNAQGLQGYVLGSRKSGSTTDDIPSASL